VKDEVELRKSYVAAMSERLQEYRVDEHGCHIWTGYADRNGYGRVYDPVRKGCYWVHRVSYEVNVGPIPEGYEIDHTCERTLCIRKECLEAVTRVEHIARTFRRLGKDDLHLMAAELRSVHGLTYAEVAEVLSLAGRGSAHDMVKSAIRKGLVGEDELPPVRRLTTTEREDIRDLYALGVPQTILGECYGVDSSQVSRICSGKTSGHR
jgi:HNH endonuclease